MWFKPILGGGETEEVGDAQKGRNSKGLKFLNKLLIAPFKKEGKFNVPNVCFYQRCVSPYISSKPNIFKWSSLR